MSTAQVSIVVKYTAPGGSSHSSAFSASPAYAGSSVGTLDIPDTTADNTAFAIPFGSIAEAKVLVLKNTNTLDMAVRFNGAMADEFQLVPGGMVTIAQPVAAGAVPVSSVSVFTTATQSGAGTFEYMVFGA